jgi:hypothetical protein
MKKIFIKRIIFIFTFLISTVSLTFYLTGCTYSFKGANPPEGIKTIFIPTVKDESGFSAANIFDNFTLTLKNKFIKDNTLEYTEKVNADGMLTCVIKNIRDEALVVQAGEQVSKRKITITVNVDFQNLKKQKSVWKKDFSNWGEYDSQSGTFSARDDGLNSAIDKITDDILLEVISNW